MRYDPNLGSLSIDAGTFENSANNISIIYLVLLLAAASLWKNCTFPIKHVKITESVVGALSGFLATTTSINGPPVILYYLNAKAEEHRDVFRANLTRYFLLINIVSIVISYIAGTLKIGELWVHTLLSIPASYIGFYWGERVFHRIDADTFKKASLLMVFISSVAIISSVLIKKL